MDSDERAFKKILIIKPSSLGDIVMALPALSALHNSFPDAKIDWMVRNEFAPLLETHPFVNEVILFDRKFLGKSWYNPRAIKALLLLISQLRDKKYDIVIDLQGLFRTAVLGWLSGCRKRFGMADARELAPVFYTNKISVDKTDIHMVDYYLKTAEAAGANKREVEFVLGENPKAKASVKKLLSEQGVDRDNYVVFIPSSAHRDKCWPVERFAELAAKIHSRYKLPAVAIGTKSEADMVAELESMSNGRVVNLAGRTSLLELTELLRDAKLVVSNDTGPGHIAAALSRPLVFIFGLSNPARVGPYGMKESVVAIEPDSRPMEFKSNDPKYDIRNIMVNDVYSKVCEQLQDIK